MTARSPVIVTGDDGLLSLVAFSGIRIQRPAVVLAEAQADTLQPRPVAQSVERRRE